MPCAKCEALESEIATLRERLYIETQEYLYLSARYHLTPNEGWVLHTLYRAGGRVVPAWSILDNRPVALTQNGCDPDNGTTRVFVCRIRKKLPGSISTHTRAGYAITAAGIKVVEAALKRPVAA